MKSSCKNDALRPSLLFTLFLGATGVALAQPSGTSTVLNPPGAVGPSGQSAPATAPSNSIVSAAATSSDVDALHRRVRTQLRVFNSWLTAYDVKGYIGEVGWPSWDSARWNALADVWYADADTANLWVTPWYSGELDSPVNSQLINYWRDKPINTSINSKSTQTQVIEAHLSTPNYQRGVNAGGGANSTDAKHNFSNANPGAYGFKYYYANRGSYQYLYNQGVRLVRIPFRWERIQPTLKTSFDSNNKGWSELKRSVLDARAVGLQVVLDMHNYARYSKAGAASYLIGSADVPIDAYTDVWTRLSNEFKTDSGIYYGLMNEPYEMNLTVNGLSGAKLWEKISQDVLNAIRVNNDTKLVMVPGYSYSSAGSWAKNHPKPWIADSANNFRYEAHNYWDGNGSGTFTKANGTRETYDEAVAVAQSKGYVANPTPPVELIQDNTDPLIIDKGTGVRLIGTWVAATSSPGYYGTNYIHNNNTGQGAKWVIYQPNLAATGTYNVYMRWTAATNRAAVVPVDIFTSNGVQTVTVNQRENGGAWILLGNFPLTWSNAHVKVRTDGTNATDGTAGFVTVDAVKFVLQ